MSIISIIETNLGMGFEMLVSIVILLGVFIFYASDFKIGALLHVIAFAGLTVVFYTQNMLYKIPLVLMFLFIVILTFTLFVTGKVSKTGGYV